MTHEEIRRLEISLEDLKTKMEMHGAQIIMQGAEIIALKTWLKVLGFIASIIVPSVWAFVFAQIINPKAVIAFLDIINLS